jgi:predicted transcriptional regulator
MKEFEVRVTLFAKQSNGKPITKKMDVRTASITDYVKSIGQEGFIPPSPVQQTEYYPPHQIEKVTFKVKNES